jgi:hypothetical protein
MISPFEDDALQHCCIIPDKPGYPQITRTKERNPAGHGG